MPRCFREANLIRIAHLVADSAAKKGLVGLAPRTTMAALFALACATGTAEAGQEISVFDPVGSYGTYPSSINNKGAVAGDYQDSQGDYHGFVRSPTGGISAFDPTGSTETEAAAINWRGDVAGSFRDSDNVFHGFVRGSDGTIAAFDPTGSAGTYAVAINHSGLVA